jgi:hypothetical protein
VIRTAEIVAVRSEVASAAARPGDEDAPPPRRNRKAMIGASR